MSMSRQNLHDEYGKTLGSHLAKADEAALHQAYQLGRQALSEGFGLLDLVLLHHEMLAILANDDTHATKRQKLDRAAEFLAESLSPFEMSLRGYREANASLAALNETLREAKAATDAANRELESFSYSVAHDLRAPLRSIDGFSQALLEDYADKLDRDGQQHLRYVRQSAQEMTELIDGLLTLSHVTRSELRREPVDLSDLVRAIVAHLRRSAPDRSVEITIQHDIVVEGDARLLRDALENLLGNAWKFTKKRAAAQIEFGAIAHDSHPVYFVRDNGAGFDMTYAAKLFGVFQRLHSTNEFEGTGIGLATVQRIVTRHGGRVWAEGEVDRGATIYFTLGGAPPRTKGAMP
jgi:light-regulated signal transduction histidine kinase (bacteriophytochrome)